MATFIYGTGNPAKLQSMRDCLAPLCIEIIGLNETGVTVPDINENGNTPLENARIKALACYAVLQRPVFACDSGLYIDGLPENGQPGVHVRMVDGKRLNDDEMIVHYAAIAGKLGGKAVARYKNAICLVISENEIYEHFGDDISGEAFCIVDKPYPKRVEGFPLDCLSVHIESGEYYYWHDKDSDAGMVFKGFQAFFRKVMSLNNTITLRNGVAVFLRNNGNYLLMKRADNRKIAPGVWSGVGGHMENNEINNPIAACYREIEEESGIIPNNVSSLELLYIIIRRSRDEIRQSYIYFGETSQSDVIQTSEGELFWIPEDELLSREYTKTFTAMLEHYEKRAKCDRAVYVGVAENDNGKLRMNWSRCEDFE